MNLIRLSAIAGALIWSTVATATLPEIVADFESLNPFATNARFPASAIRDTEFGVDVQVEAVQYRAAGPQSAFGSPPQFGAAVPGGSGVYIANGPSGSATFTPTDTRGFYLRVGSESGLGDLFDFDSTDVTNYTRTSSTTRQYMPSTIQISTQNSPLPYVPGSPSAGWTVATSPGQITDQPPALQFETLHLADNPDPAFPASQFHGIRAAFIGLDNVRGLDNIHVRWSRANFDAPTAVQFLSHGADSSDVVRDGTAIFQHPTLDASGNGGPVTITSTETTDFRWATDPLLTSNFPARIAGELGFHVLAEGGAAISVRRTWTLTGPAINDSGLADIPMPDPSIQPFDQDITLLATEYLQHGFLTTSQEPIHLTTTLTITIDPRGGHGNVTFDRGWEVRIAGTSAVPEPTSLELTVVALTIFWHRRITWRHGQTDRLNGLICG